MGTDRRVDGQLRPGAADKTHVTGVPAPQVSAAHQLHQPPTSLLVLGQEVDAVDVELEVAVGRAAETGAACRAASCRPRRRVGVDARTLAASTTAAAGSHSVSGGSLFITVSRLLSAHTASPVLSHHPASTSSVPWLPSKTIQRSC